MRVVLQRVGYARLYIDGKLHAQIGRGLFVLACVCEDDTEKDLEYVARKIANMRIFADSNGKFNLSLLDVDGEALVVSQFTLAADTKKGNRPSYFYAKNPEEAKPMFERFLDELQSQGVPVKSGVFGAMMDIELKNTGPVTIYLDSKENLRK